MPQTIRLAEQILAISKQSWAEDSAKGAELTETEFLSLEYLVEHGTATVGEIRETIGVLPAQMSRILRSLEEGQFVNCEINARDKRKVDVSVTSAGRASFEQFRSAKLATIVDALERLTADEQTRFMALLDKMTSQQRR